MSFQECLKDKSFLHRKVLETNNVEQASENISGKQSNGLPPDSMDAEGFEAGSVRSAGIDGSMGSDTDTSKAEALGGVTKEGENRDAVPRYTVKKSASFKPVSVTKSFLAKAGSTVAPIKTTGEKGLCYVQFQHKETDVDIGVASPGSPAPGSAVNASRPRLVAKPASSQRIAPKSLAMGLKKGGASGPDPNQVWNRNRGWIIHSIKSKADYD